MPATTADPEELKARLAAAGPKDTVRGIVFNAAFALLRELAGQPAARECDPAGTGRRSEYFSYPVADYLRLAWAGADRLGERLGGADAVFWELGARAAGRWLDSALGRTLAAIAGTDPRRLVTNTATGYRNVVSYGTRTVEWLAPRHARIRFERDFLVPPFHCGVLVTALDRMGHVPVRADGRSRGLLESEYDVTW
jgi:uncharacterized protein (TIGR02265 family)